MKAQMVITHAPDRYIPSDGMTPCQFRFISFKGRGTCASVGTPTVAVHVLMRSLPVAPAGTHLCAYHSPYDVHTAPASERKYGPEGRKVYAARVRRAWDARPQGVSLGKATDRDVPGVESVIPPTAPAMPGSAPDLMRRNDLRGIARVLRVKARLGR